MLITNKAQYTCHKALIWLRVSLTCCTYVLGEDGGLWYFPLINQHLLTGGQKKTPEIIRGGFKIMKGKNKEIIIAHPLDKLWMLPKNTWWDKCASSCLKRRAKEKNVGGSRGKFAARQKNGTLLLFNKKGNKRKEGKNIAANQGWKAKSSILDSVVPKPNGQFRIQEA